jgi:hypothetical protein
MSVKKSKVSDPQHLRRRAEEARTLADELTDPEAKRKMLKIAEEYETLAIRAVQRLRHHSFPIDAVSFCPQVPPYTLLAISTRRHIQVEPSSNEKIGQCGRP